MFYSPVDNPLCPHGQQWTVVEEIIVEAEKSWNIHTSLHWNDQIFQDFELKTPINYFYHLFPMKHLANIVEHTNNGLIHEYNQTSTSKGELLKWLGIRLVGVLERNRGNFSDNWAESVDTDMMLRPGDYKNCFGMSKNRFFSI